MGKIPLVAKDRGPSGKDPQHPRECYVANGVRCEIADVVGGIYQG
jgi:hypothetical protein